MRSACLNMIEGGPYSIFSANLQYAPRSEPGENLSTWSGTNANRDHSVLVVAAPGKGMSTGLLPRAAFLVTM